jgi:hypothetical protein
MRPGVTLKGIKRIREAIIRQGSTVRPGAEKLQDRVIRNIVKRT